MNKKEAIDAIKCNYPPEHYSILREALDMAIKELEVTSKEALEAAEVISTYYTDAPNNNCEEIKCSLYQWCVKGE